MSRKHQNQLKGNSHWSRVERATGPAGLGRLTIALAVVCWVATNRRMWRADQWVRVPRLWATTNFTKNTFKVEQKDNRKGKLERIKTIKYTLPQWPSSLYLPTNGEREWGPRDHFMCGLTHLGSEEADGRCLLPGNIPSH